MNRGEIRSFLPLHAPVVVLSSTFRVDNEQYVRGAPLRIGGETLQDDQELRIPRAALGTFAEDIFIEFWNARQLPVEKLGDVVTSIPGPYQELVDELQRAMIFEEVPELPAELVGRPLTDRDDDPRREYQRSQVARWTEAVAMCRHVPEGRGGRSSEHFGNARVGGIAFHRSSRVGRIRPYLRAGYGDISEQWRSETDIIAFHITFGEHLGGGEFILPADSNRMFFPSHEPGREAAEHSKRTGFHRDHPHARWQRTDEDEERRSRRRRAGMIG